MASIREKKLNDGSVSYQVQIRMRGHRPVSAAFKRVTDAKKWIQETETAIRDGRYFKNSEASRHTLTELIDRFASETLKDRAKFRHEYMAHLHYWKEQLGHLRLSDLSKTTIATERDRLSRTLTRHGKKRSPATVNRYLASLSSAVRTGIEDWGWLEENPVRHVRKLKEPHGRKRFLSDEERERFFAVCQESPNPDLLDLVKLAINFGCRRMELWALTWADVDLKNKLVFFRQTKNDTPRSLPLVGEVLDILKRRSKIRRLDTQLLFPSKKDPQKPFDFRAPFLKALKVAEIEDFRWHDLRHSCGSYLAMNGVPIRTIAEILGQKTTAMAVRYSHLNQDHLRESLRTLEETMERHGS